MAFLDNSGDIILDAVLTDTGRMRLARGDGSFRIVKFAVGDDEINYGRYDKLLPTAYSDLEILQTPILEAFTNNSSNLFSKLMTIPRENVLFLPVMVLNEVFSNSTKRDSTTNSFLIAVDNETEQEFALTQAGLSMDGLLFGEDPAAGGNYIRVDQGLNTTQIAPQRALDPDLVESAYMIEVDNRFATIVSSGQNAVPATLSFIDDDQIATYTVALGLDPEFVMENSDTTENVNQVITGPRGTMLSFKVLASLEVNSSNYLFDTLGKTESLTGANGSVSVRSIDTFIRIMGGNTGYRFDIPVKFIKKI